MMIKRVYIFQWVESMILYFMQDYSMGQDLAKKSSPTISSVDGVSKPCVEVMGPISFNLVDFLVDNFGV